MGGRRVPGSSIGALTSIELEFDMCEVSHSSSTWGGALDRIRTCDTRFRRAVLYPLSYEGGTFITVEENLANKLIFRLESSQGPPALRPRAINLAAHEDRGDPVIDAWVQPLATSERLPGPAMRGLSSVSNPRLRAAGYVHYTSERQEKGVRG